MFPAFLMVFLPDDGFAFSGIRGPSGVVGRISVSAIRHMQNQVVTFVGRISARAIRQSGINGR